MPSFKSEDKDLRSSGPAPAERETGEMAAWLTGLTLRLKAAIRRLNRPVVMILVLITVLSVVAFVAGYLSLRPPVKVTAVRKPVPPANLGWQPISERVQQAQQGQFPIDDGILTTSKSLDAADGEILSVVGTFALPGFGAAQIESGESWGVTGENHDEFVMYVHNFLEVPITAMVLRISEGTCASYGPQSTTTWASAYWGDSLAGGKEAIFHATLPDPYRLPSYCAVVSKVYSTRQP